MRVCLGDTGAGPMHPGAALLLASPLGPGDPSRPGPPGGPPGSGVRRVDPVGVGASGFVLLFPRFVVFLLCVILAPIKDI